MGVQIESVLVDLNNPFQKTIFLRQPTRPALRLESESVQLSINLCFNKVRHKWQGLHPTLSHSFDPMDCIRFLGNLPSTRLVLPRIRPRARRPGSILQPKHSGLKVANLYLRPSWCAINVGARHYIHGRIKVLASALQALASTKGQSNAPRPARQVAINTGVGPVLASLLHPIHDDPSLPIEVAWVAHGVGIVVLKWFDGIPNGEQLGGLELVLGAEATMLIWACW